MVMKHKLWWNSKCDEIQIVMKHKFLWKTNCNGEEKVIMKHKLWQNTNCGKTQNSNQTQIMTKVKLWLKTNWNKIQIVLGTQYVIKHKCYETQSGTKPRSSLKQSGFLTHPWHFLEIFFSLNWFYTYNYLLFWIFLI